jgi:hypothetical protein
MPVVVNYRHKTALSLPPEFITNQDGHDKQDCENTAAKRWLASHVKEITGYYGMPPIILGDDLYSREPVMKAILAERADFILTCKPKSHKWIMDFVTAADGDPDMMKTFKTIINTDGVKIRHEIKFCNNIKATDSKTAMAVSYFEYRTFDAKGKQLYMNAFVTSLDITTANCLEIAMVGRTRWKIENEQNNAMKNHGYNLEHNFGHGVKTLSALLATMNSIAFLFHTVLNIVDKRYKAIRDAMPRKKMIYDHLRTLTCCFCFKSWDDFLRYLYSVWVDKQPINPMWCSM